MFTESTLKACSRFKPIVRYMIHSQNILLQSTNFNFLLNYWLVLDLGLMFMLHSLVHLLVV